MTWLDPAQAIEQARAVRDAFARARPAAKGQLETRYGMLERDPTALDTDLKAALASFFGKPLLASHPICQHLVRRYGLDVTSFAWEPGEMPDAAEWRKLEEALGSRRARWMLWEATPLGEIASRLKGLGVGAIVFDPSPNVPGSGDFMALTRRNLANVRGGIRPMILSLYGSTRRLAQLRIASRPAW